MNDWVKKLFFEHADLFLKLMNQRWTRTEELVDGMIRVVNGFGLTSGNLLERARSAQERTTMAKFYS
jgi:hypothetical protein